MVLFWLFREVVCDGYKCRRKFCFFFFSQDSLTIFKNVREIFNSNFCYQGILGILMCVFRVKNFIQFQFQYKGKLVFVFGFKIWLVCEIKYYFGEFLERRVRILRVLGFIVEICNQYEYGKVSLKKYMFWGFVEGNIRRREVGKQGKELCNRSLNFYVCVVVLVVLKGIRERGFRRN